MRKRYGSALLLVVGALALLTLLGTSFALNMILARKDAANFLNSVKAKYIAEGGIARALVDIRNAVTNTSYNNLTTYVNGYVAASGTDIPLGQGTYTIAFSTDGLGNVMSEAEKVNINSFDETDASQISILAGFLTNQQIANIIDYRDYDAANTTIGASTGNIEGTANCKDKPFDSIEEVKIATGISDATFRANSKYLTINKPIIRGGLLGRYYSNITGISPSVSIDKSSYKGKVVELGHLEEHYLQGTDGDVWDQGSGWTESHDAEFAGGYLVSTTADFGIESFGVIWDGYIEILPSEVGSPITFRVMVDDGAKMFINGQSILPAGAWQDQSASLPGYSGTYTFPISGWHKLKIEYYDGAASNTLRVKWGGTDWDTAAVVPSERFGYEAPTELPSAQVYNCAGNYNITCDAKVTKGILVLAQKSISAVMKVFGTWTQTTKNEWFAAWFNDYAAGIPAGYTYYDGTGALTLPAAGGDDYRDGEMRNVTWLDSCPLNATQDIEAGGFGTMADSLKLGFWANFEDDPTSSVLFFKGLVKTDKWGPNAWNNVVRDNGSHNFFQVSWGDIRDEWPVGAPDGRTELCIETGVHTSLRFEVNPFYYFPSTSNPAVVANTPNVFMRAWTATYPAPGAPAKAYWRGTGTEYTGAYDADGNPSTNTGGIPVVGGVEQINTPYIPYGTGGWSWYGVAYDINFDGLYQVGERICKVWPASSVHIMPGSAGDRKAIYDASNYNAEATDAYTYWQPDIPFTTAMMYAAGERMDSVSGSGFGQGSRGFGLLSKDNDSYWDGTMKGWTYPEDNDMLELTLDSANGGSPAYNDRVNWMGSDWKASPVLVIIGNGGNYSGWQRYPAWNKKVPQLLPSVAATTTVSVPNFQFLSRNAYDANDAWNFGMDWAKWMCPKVSMGGWQMDRTGANTDESPPIGNGDDISLTTYWDNIRIIPESGFLVSTPCVARASSDPDVKWGTVSWTENKPANTDLKVYLRYTSTGLPTSDNFSTLYSNGAQIAGTGRVMQYKVVLSSTDFDPTTANFNLVGGKTPRLDDITITYVPSVSVFYWR